MNISISDNTQRYSPNKVTPAANPRNIPAKTNEHFNILDISNHHDKIVPKNSDFRRELHFDGSADDIKALKGSSLEMDSLHLAKKRHVPTVDKKKLDPEDFEEEIDDFDEDSELFDISTKRISLQGRTKIHTIAEEDKTSTKLHNFDLGFIDSIHLTKKRMEESE